MPLIQSLRLIFPTIQPRHEVSREAHQRLNSEEDISNQTENSVRGLEVYPAVGKLVILDNDEAGDEEVESEVV